jgi:uncharacterized membrane protein YGL010W
LNFAQKMRAWMPLHENGVSRAAHLLGGYLFVFALLVPLAWARVDVGGFSLTGAHALVAAVALSSVALEWTAGILASVLLAPTFVAAETVSRLPTGTALGIALGVMVFRFAIVVGGHVLFEKKTHGLSLGGRRPHPLLHRARLPHHPRAVRNGLQARADARGRRRYEPVPPVSAGLGAASRPFSA